MSIVCETGYPYDFAVSYKISGSGKLAVRIPKWSADFTLTINGEKKTPAVSDGYVYLTVSDGDEVSLTLDGTPRFVYASPKIPRLSGSVALCRGPLVYCFEGADNGGDVLSLKLDTAAMPNPIPFDPDLLGGTVKISADAYRTEQTEGLYTSIKPPQISCKAVAVPYYTWGNRGENQMRVWLPQMR